MTWLDAFEGIDYTPMAGEATSFADVIGPRSLANNGYERPATDRVLVPLGSLHAIADRIDTLSRALVAAQGGGAPLDQAALDAHAKAEQEAAERAAVKRGILAEDAEGDWAALYDHTGRKARASGHVSDVRSTAVREGWSVVVLDCEGVLDADTGEDFPETIDALKRMLAERGHSDYGTWEARQS